MRSFPGVAPGVRFFKVGYRQFGVMLQSLKIFMPKKVFDVIEVCSVSDQLRCRRPPEHVRCYVCLNIHIKRYN